MWGTSLDLIHMVRCTNFMNVLGNRCMQSATDDPEFVPPSTETSDSAPMKGLIVGRCTANI